MSKIDYLISALTLQEKIGMIHGDGLFQTKGVERLGIPPLKMADGPMGVRNEFQNDTWVSIGLTDDYVSYLPSNTAIASTWNRACAYGMGQVLGAEARGRGKDIILAPGINIKRSPLCGRNFEYMSEDPYLISEMAVPFIKGVQENDVAACVKHFAVNNQETERLWVETVIDDQALREIYLPGFYSAVTRGNAYSIMGAYNLLRGEHCCQSKWLLKDVLREEWGYDGVVVSDWGGVHDTQAAAISGLDIEMSVTNNFDDYYMANPLKEAVEKGEIDEALIDEKIRHILNLMDRLHMLEGERKTGQYNVHTHRQAILEAAEESIVLLKNTETRLPLDKNNFKKILVIGDNGERIHSNGGGSAEIKALYEISPLMGLKSQLGGNVEVVFARGYEALVDTEESETNWQETSLEAQQVATIKQVDEARLAREKELREEAVKLAQEIDEVILVCGLNHDYDTEGKDREDMKLPYKQDELIKAVLEVNPNTIIVIQSGSPVEMHQWVHQAKAVVWMGYIGMEGGNALANVLLGKVNPSGRLAETFPKVLEDSPAHCIGEFPGDKQVDYKEGIYVGYRYYDTYDVEPEFCFGHGLSYTTFEYNNLRIQPIENNTMKVTVELTNTGLVEGLEVAQLYIGSKQKDERIPFQTLKGYEKVHLKPQETKEVQFLLDQDSFAYYDTVEGKMKVQDGQYEIRIGQSSRAILLKAQVSTSTL